MTLNINAEICIGCRICELICNFYHEERFGSQNSIIKIRFDKDGKLDINFSKSCDCRSKNKYPCINFCPVNAIIISSSKENKVVKNYYESMKT
jgi:Fe-S-cluster-containing hydrogenase component 2